MSQDRKCQAESRSKKASSAGAASFGMMCSIEELGSTTDMYPEAPEDGIYIFPETAEVGASAIEALDRNDVVFEYEVTSNRVDCYSVLGIAREAAATFNKEFVSSAVVERQEMTKMSTIISK